MNFNKFLLLLIVLFLSIAAVSASEENITDADNCEVVGDSDEMVVVSDFDEEVYSEPDDTIVVNDWNELQYYCSLNDKNYSLKLKENTNFYPTNPSDIAYQIVINNNVTILGSEGAYIGDDSSNASDILYTAFITPDDSKVGLTLKGIEFKWIKTDYGPDGVFLTMAGDTFNLIEDCNFHDINTNMGHSCIVYIRRGDATLNNCTFVNCTTDFGSVSIYDPRDNPTGVCRSARMLMNGCYFENNSADVEPGCINNCGVLIVKNTTFHKNSANWWAGAIHTHCGANTTVYCCNFTDNVAGWNGGALYTYSWLQIYNSTFKGNNCTTNNGGGAIGACYFGTSPFIHIENSIFEDNENTCWGLDELSTTTTGRGGAISIMDDGLLEVFNSTFIKNSASIGTAIDVVEIDYSGYKNPLDVRLIGNKFINHTRVGDVLVINVKSTSVCELENNTYLNNSIEFSKIELVSQGVENNISYFEVSPVLKHPNYYDADILNKSEYLVYVDGILADKISETNFSLNMSGIDSCRVYVVPTISNRKSNEVTVYNPVDSNVSIDVYDMEYGERQYITFAVMPDDATGNLTVHIGNASYLVYLNNPTLDLGILDIGHYEVLAIYKGDKTHLPSNATASFDITRKTPVLRDITVCNREMTIVLSENATGNLNLDIGRRRFSQDVVNGSAVIDLGRISGGFGNATISYSGDSLYKPALIKDVGVFIPYDTRITIFSIYDQFNIDCVLSDERGDVISNASVFYTVGGSERFNTTTGEDGVFTVLAEDNCVIRFFFEGDDDFCPSDASITLKNIKPLPKDTEVVVPSTMTKTAVDYNAGEKGSMFYFTLQDSEGKPLAKKSVKIGIFDKIYTVKTDSNGVGGLMINIANANYYTYAITFLGDENYKASFAVCSLQIVKKSVTITPAKTSYSFKTSAKTKTVTATLKSSNSYIPKGKQVTLTIAGKTFKATIGANGQISFNIGSITKKGTYNVAIKFAGTNTYAAANSKTITIKIS